MEQINGCRRGEVHGRALASILMPALNARGTIANAISSVIAQTYEAWELLIIADDDFDYSYFVRKENLWDRRIRFARTPAVRSGVSAALNIGRQLASGLVVTRLDADDWYEPDRLATLVPLAMRYGVVGDNALAFEDLKKKYFGPWLRTYRSMVDLDLFNLMISPIPFLLLFRRDILPEWDQDLSFAEDVVFNARAFEHVAEVPIVTKSLWNYRIHDASLSSSAAPNDEADLVYVKLLRECEADHARLRCPGLQQSFRDALAYKRAVNRAFRAARSRDHALSFQEFVLEKRGDHCDCDLLRVSDSMYESRSA